MLNVIKLNSNHKNQENQENQENKKAYKIGRFLCCVTHVITLETKTFDITNKLDTDKIFTSLEEFYKHITENEKYFWSYNFDWEYKRNPKRLVSTQKIADLILTHVVEIKELDLNE